VKATLKINDVEKDFSKSLSIDWLTTAMATFRTTLPKPENLTAFSEVSVERDGVEIFGGVILEPKIEFGSSGTSRPIKGFDYTVKLLDFLCPYQSLVDVTTEAALTAILTNWPYDTDFSGIYSYLATLTEYDTSWEFLSLIDYFGCCIEYKQTNEQSLRIETQIAQPMYVPDPEHRSCFFYDGTTERLYAFYERANNLFYRHSSDGGATWSGRVDTGKAVQNGNHFSLGWYEGKVYLFLEDAGGSTDFYRGLITDATGNIVFALINNNIFANWIRSGPFFTPNGNIWVVEEDGANGDAWESVNDGVAWNNRFTPTEDLYYMLPKSDGEDMWLIEWDVGNNDLELWDWDKSTTTEAYENLIRDFGADVLEHVAGAQTANFSIRLAYSDDDNDLWFRASNEGGVWGTEQSVTVSLDATTGFHICADRYDYAYIGYQTNAGLLVAKGNELTYIAGAGGIAKQGDHVSCPASGQWDGKYACFFITEDKPLVGEIYFCLMNPEGIRLDDGEHTGYFVTETITAGGAFVKWGWVTGSGTKTEDMSWSILKDADDSILADRQVIGFDMDAAGVPATETSIKIRSDLTDWGTDPLLIDFGWGEFLDEVTIDTDLTEDLYTGIEKLRSLSGGEFWVTKDNGGYTLHYANERGSNKSNVVVLKNAHSSRRPSVPPNVKVVSKTPDWGSFANSIMIIGAGDAGVDRIEEFLQDGASIILYGEKWYSEVNLDMITDLMGQTLASVIMGQKNEVVERIVLSVLDTYDPGAISIGDTVWIAVDFADVAQEEINEALRIIGLNRTFTPEGGEDVTVTVVNQRKAIEYWNFLGRVQDLTRWSVI
jgi:hypothetical protein